MTYPMLTAQQAADQGSTPSLFFSIARFTANKDLAERARRTGRELAGLLRMDLGGRRAYSKPGNSKPAAAKADNDNRNYGKPRNRRAA